jgi:hypothetical protein
LPVTWQVISYSLPVALRYKSKATSMTTATHAALLNAVIKTGKVNNGIKKI